MPLIQVNVFENELSPDQAQELINKITDAYVSISSEKIRDVTWVIVNEVKSGHWGIGGKTLGLDDVHKLMSS